MIRSTPNETLNGQADDKRFGAGQLVILFLSIYVLVELFVEVAFELPEEIITVLHTVDDVICFVFLFDFFYRLHAAKSKLAYLKWGWIDFVSSIPLFNVLRMGRLLRVIRLLRLLRGIRSIRAIARVVFVNRSKAALASVVILTFSIMMFASMGILTVERLPESNIKTAEDALWWAIVTITTIGYGDKYPVTGEGRVFAVFLMLAGVGLFGTFTGFVSSWFVEDDIDKKEELSAARERDLKERLERMEATLEEIKKKLG